MSQGPTLAELVSTCAARLPEPAAAFHRDLRDFEAELMALLEAVRGTDERFAFDRAGRPAAVATIRNALPAIERELFDAVLDDFACELAATQEAMYRLIEEVRNARPAPPSPSPPPSPS